MAALGQVHALVRRYFLGLIAIAIPLLILIAGLAVAQFRAERAVLLDTMARDTVDLQLILDGFLKSADDHVRQLRQSAESHLSGLLPLPHSPLRALLRGEHGDNDGMWGESPAPHWSLWSAICTVAATCWYGGARMTGKSTWRLACSSSCIWGI
jgi:hypothetical protein